MSWYTPLFAALTAGLALAVALILFRPESFGSHARAVFIAGVIIGLGLRLLMPLASPAPVIDVFVVLQESAQHLLAGQNPYTTAVSDVYAGQQNYGYQLFGYVYLPANLYFQTLSYALTGDVRYIHVVAEALAIWALYRISPDRARGQWLVLLFLFMPRGLFLIEQAWIDPLIVGAYGMVSWLAERQPGSRWLAASYGLMLSFKQYLLFFALHGLMLERRPARLLLAAGVGLATIVPFLIADPQSLYTYGFVWQLNTGFRSDGLTLVAALYAMTGLTVGKGFSALVGAVVAVPTFYWFRNLGTEGWRWASLLTTITIFIFGGQAFMNYYYWVEVLILFLIASRR